MLKSRLLSMAIAAALATVASAPAFAVGTSSTAPGVPLAHATADANGPVMRDGQGRILYTVLLKNLPTAMYHGPDVQQVAGLAKIPSSAGDDGKLDLQSSAAKAYASYLSTVQVNLLAKLHRSGMNIQAVTSYQVALNGFTAWLSEADARKLADMPEVQLVHKVVRHELLTGAEVIGAPEVWFGTDDASADSIFANGFDDVLAGHRGEGIVIGDLDTGINFPSHSFDVTSPSGFTISNPLGSGNYLGWCNAGYNPADGQVAADPCSDKIIGSYDFAYWISQIVPDTFDYPGAMDETGHGSHTASTAAGVTRAITYAGYDITISGVAPHANLVAYDVCLEGANGGCYGVSTSAAVDQAIQDGVVDVLNYSIGGGGEPWNDPTERAFLSAVDSGIFVAASAGNSGPAYGTTGHLGPWMTTVGATTHDFTTIHWAFTVDTGSYFWYVGLGEAGAKPTTGLPTGTMTILSPDFATANDGCSTYPADTFTDTGGNGGVAMIAGGGCAANVKAGNAASAGAIMVVIVPASGGAFKPLGEPAALIPVFGISNQGGSALATLLASGPIAAYFPYPGLGDPETPDQVVDFSSRGPGALNLLKPDVAAPGVGIVAAWAGGPNGNPDTLNNISGTSMASPHVAGSAALIKQIHPDWTPMEIKSALMLTAKPSSQLLEYDGATPAIPLDAGAGRINVDQAVKAGLVMDESGIHMLQANPDTGGDPSTLNLASLYDDTCITECAFTRTMTGALPGSQTWDITTSGIGAPASVSLSTNSITALPGVGSSFTVTVDTSTAQPGDAGFYFGQLTLTNAGNPDTPVLHMPISFAIPSAQIELVPDSMSFTVAAGGTDSADLDINNLGGVPLAWNTTNAAGAAPVLLLDQQATSTTGYPNSEYTTVSGSIYEADDFVVASDMKLKTATAYGFQQPSSGNLSGIADSITFTVYADASGAPAGVPGGSGTPAYTCTLLATGAPANGLGFDGDVVTLDVAAAAAGPAACPALPALTVGTYWLVVYPTYSYPASAVSWYQFESAPGNGTNPMVVSPTQGLPSWTDATTVFTGAPPAAIAMHVVGGENCGAPWLSLATASGQVGVGGSTTVSLAVDTTGMTAGTYDAFACIASNDPVTPVAAIPVTLTVQ